MSYTDTLIVKAIPDNTIIIRKSLVEQIKDDPDSVNRMQLAFTELQLESQKLINKFNNAEDITNLNFKITK